MPAPARAHEEFLVTICTRFGCVFRRHDYRRRPDGFVEGWCGGTPHSGVWLTIEPTDIGG